MSSYKNNNCRLILIKNKTIVVCITYLYINSPPGKYNFMKILVILFRCNIISDIFLLYAFAERRM